MQEAPATLGFLARMHVLLFILLSFLASVVGAFFGLAAGIFLSAVISLLTKANNDNIDTIITLIFGLVGLVYPPVILYGKRYKKDNTAYIVASPIASKKNDPTERHNGVERVERRPVRIIDWGFLLYDLLYIPVLLLILVGDGFRGSSAAGLQKMWMIVAIPAIFTTLLEFLGTSINSMKLTYPVRIQIYGPFAFPIFMRTIDLQKAAEATADTQYQNVRFRELNKLRIMYISGDFMQAKIWFSSKGRRDWLFSQLHAVAPHIRQYRGRW
jgi:uncharacterized membrane protein